MGHKKRNSAPRPKQSPAASPAATHHAVGGAATTFTADCHTPAESEPCSNAIVPNPIVQAKIETMTTTASALIESDGGSSSPYSNIKLECDRTLTALRRGNHTKALRLMKELCQRHENSPHSALVHRVQGTVCVRVASIIDDPNAKNRHLRNAIESARRAVELSPNSIEFAHFYANLLYEAANDGKEYEEVVQECERALSIENPIDPAKESLQEESQQRISTSEARIVHVQNELRQLIRNSNVASISTWMKNLGNGEEKFRLIPIRRASEDPMEVRLVQARRPNEIKKTPKTSEERRKEIEVRVAAARLLQQKSEVPQSQNEGDKADKGLDSSSGSGQRAGGERRKYGNARKSRSSSERKDFVRSFWNSLSFDTKKEMLKIKVSDLKAHFGSSKDGLANEVISEALLFAESNRTWKFWVCCRCNARFADSESHMHHVVQDHMGNLLPKMQTILPQCIEDDWREMLLNYTWKPLDVSAADKMLRNQTKCRDSEFVEGFCEDHNGDCNGCFKDVWDSSSHKEILGDSHGDSTVESTDCEKIVSIECRECDEHNGSIPYSSLAYNWPISDDSERARLLERIRDVFEVLIRHKYLATSHLNRLIQFTMDELQRIASGSQLLNHGVEQTPMCICFLGASQLRKILKFLQELSHSCDLARYSGSINPVDDANSGTQSLEIKERIVLNGDASFLLLDECLLSAESTPIIGHHAATPDGNGAASAIVSHANGVLTESNTLLSWIFSGPASGEQLASWVHTKEEKTHEGMEILQMLEKEFFHLQTLCDRKCEHLSYEEALQAVEDLCVEEGKKRENATEFVHESFESVLRKRREYLVEIENDVMLTNSQIELDAISSVLKEAEALNTNQFGYEETYAGVTSQLYDLESGEDDDWRAKDYLHQVDTCVEVAIQRQKEQLYIELSKIDARIMRNVSGMQQLELKLEPVSAHDYRSILLPLVKSYLRAHLEDLAEKDATEKSDAAREAFLAELALDSKKGVKGGNDFSRHTQEKSKDKKKNKEYKKAKDSKAPGISEQHIFHDETCEPVYGSSIPVATDGDHPDSEIVNSLNGDDFKQEEEEFRRRVELEALERKLEETLEYQRRIEKEAKQKHLAEQHKKSSCLHSEKADDGLLNNVYLKCAPVDSGVQEQSKPFVQQQLDHKNGIPNNFEGMPLKTPNGSAVMKSSTVLQGLPNGGVSEDGYLPSDRRTGRRSRRQRNSAKISDGKHQKISSNKENMEIRSLQLQGRLKEQATSHDNALADGIIPVSGDNGTKSLRQLQAEDDEERFQADLKKAVLQSLDDLQAQHKVPLVSKLKTPHGISGDVDNRGISPSDVTINNVNGGDVYGTGLKNEVGEYNCFLNVIIQSLWHIRRFRDEFLGRSTSEHVHVGDPCVVCALYEIFKALNVAAMDAPREAVDPTSLRTALSKLYPNSNFFQEAQMNDASEVLAVIFDCLHRSFTPGSSVSDTDSLESNCMGSWDCTNNSCIAHSIFGMDIFERMNCYNCSLESRRLKYTSFFHNINASALRTMKVMCNESSFEELLNLVEMNHQLACDPGDGGCGKLNYIHHILSTPPHVFTTVLGWQNTCEDADDITATLAALNTDIDISVLYRGLDPKNMHGLVSVVCYYGQHYHCFAYSHEQGRWIKYDDGTVKVIGDWADVLTECEIGHLQPQVLFYEAVN
ncbi:uncharacterized protein LOC107415685 isoform X1 [Ziziphus jujuba]|uniref:Uncharacterized protein LOC107415685 isoform X1 n=1 Tax=Ziziphus jujuba TaxID=326968 RepID=A0A6P3ZLI3_ZIZJJ|nr:uncharacterized protein LOC107415685 isoform X1 [Ziziphus jujuba]